MTGETAVALFNPDTLQQRLNADPEFVIKASFLTARIKLATGRQVLNLRFIDGIVVSLNDVDTGFDSYDVLLEGDVETWARILEEVPPPFYQDFWSAKFHHGFRIEGNLDLMSAYYSAIRRMCDVLRELNREAAA